ncbi:hypothetical protein [Nocardioides campestrisoli]|uniref:hypothetical protein n=1 Tax=Nocardioides campestrisoli TaxID=2736757 RepID=UPI0015E7874D|nr:hypothetical protein [Nocardioides campestrisoli]
MNVDELADELAEALVDDPVVVDPLFGNGRTEEVREALTEAVEELDFPAYVVLVPRPEGLSASDPDRELATLLHERIGGDGVYVVHTDTTGYGDAVVSFGDVPAADVRYEVSLRQPAGEIRELNPAGHAARDLAVIAADGRLSQADYEAYAEETIWQRPPEWDVMTREVPDTGAYAFFTTLAFVVVGGSAWLVLRTIARWRETGLVPQPRAALPVEGPAQVRARAERELDALAERLAATADRPLSAETRELVDGSYDTARGVLADAGTEERDLADLVGALVLVRVADRALDAADAAARPRSRRASRRAPLPAYLPCYFDPRHGEAVRRHTVPVGDRRLAVPACRHCSDTLDGIHTGPPHPMLVPAGLLGRPRPWYEQDTVWARTGYGASVDELWPHVAGDRRRVR